MTLCLRFRRATLLLTRGILAPYAISRRLRRRSACETSVGLRRRRFRLGCFLVRMTPVGVIAPQLATPRQLDALAERAFGFLLGHCILPALTGGAISAFRRQHQRHV